MSKVDWLKRLKRKAGKYSIKRGASQACDISGSRSRRGKDREKVDQDCARPRRRVWMDQDCKPKKWIDGSRLKKARSNQYTDAQVGDTEGLLKSLKWIEGSRLKKARPKKQSL